MSRARLSRVPRAVLALAVFLSWMGGTLFHFHPEDAPTCKVCQALHSNQADVPAQNAPAPLSRTAERIGPLASTGQTEAPVPAPHGRAPPSA
jgi:hypothetical protein